MGSKLLVIVSLFFANSAFSKTFLITDNSTNEQYECKPYTSGPAPVIPEPVGPINDCAVQVTKACVGTKLIREDWCIEGANEVCKVPFEGAAECVMKSFNSCDLGHISPSICYDWAVKGCKIQQ